MAGISSFTSQVMAALGRLKVFTTAQLPATAPPGQMVYDSTVDAAKVVNNDGVTYTTLGGGSGGITIGQAVIGGGANRIIFEDGSQNLATSAGLTYNGTNLATTAQIRVAATGSAAPSIGLTGTANTGVDITANGPDVYVSGSSVTRWVNSSTYVVLRSTWQYAWSSGDPDASAGDTGFKRAAAGVSATTNGSSGVGWLQQSAGELALAGNYTNATAGFTNTNLSATVVSGRTYSFECVLFFDDSTAVDGAQFDFNGGTATVTNFRAQAFAFNNVGGALALTNGAVTAINTAIQVTLALTTQAMIVIKGTFVPSSSATFIVRAAQTAHSAGTLTVDRGSYLNIRDANPL